MVIKQKHLIAFQIYYLLIVEFLIDILHFPEIIRYVLDINAIFLVFLALPKIQDMLRDKIFKYFNIYIILYMAAIILFSVVRMTPIGRILWATRNNYLYVTFFLCSAYTLKTSELSKILENVVRFQAFNAVCVLYEFVLLGKRDDFLGGMFGTQQGCNGYLNNYLFVITAWAVVMFAQKKIRTPYLLWIILSSIAIAAASELKFFYIELVVIVVSYLVLSKASFNNGFVLLVAVMLFFVAVNIIGKIDPEIVKFYSDFDTVSTYSKQTYGNTTISRGTAISQINEYFFGGSWKKNLFGLGFGYCEESKSFRWANSAFARKFSYLGYRNLSVAMIFLESGYIGLIGFIAIFVWIFVFAQIYKNELKVGKHFVYLSQILSILAIINIWYNSCIRRESAYLTFLVLSGLIIPLREKMRSENKPEKEVEKKKSHIKSNSRRIKW